jgi:cytidine deaminase
LPQYGARARRIGRPEKHLRPNSPEPCGAAVLQALFSAAMAARQHAYAPYSRFRVGAAVLAANGTIHAGCNVENAAYPVGTCAEQAAIAAMVAAGETRIRAVLVLGNGPQLVTPCGACRQRLREFAAGDLPVHCADETGIRQSWRLDQLLPASFGPDNLPPEQGPAP